MMLLLESFKDKFKDKSRDEILEEMFEIYKENEKLEKELKKYKNANTPSSSNKHIKASSQGLKAVKGAKRGAPKGHKGATFVFPEAEETVTVFNNQCVNCNGKNIQRTGYNKEKNVICLREPRIYVRKYIQEEVRCLDCFTISLAQHRDIPDKGIYDKNIQSRVNYYRFKGRMPINRIVDVMNNLYHVPMTQPTCLEITRRASNKLEGSYRQLEVEIKQQNVVHGDETSHSVNGVNHWIWVFCNAMISLFKFNKERGGTIVEETLGKDFKGKLVSDGWRTYTVYTCEHKVVHGRCWSHGLREVKFECKKKHPDLYKWYCDIYDMAKKGKKYKQEKRRLIMYEKCKAELSRWVIMASAHRSLRKLATKIKNGGDDWFTAILYPEVPLDNNEAERSIRPFVVMRKIIGCLRSEVGVRTHEVMMSLISTWEKQGKNVFYTLQTTL